jgi:hypothetical protein
MQVPTPKVINVVREVPGRPVQRKGHGPVAAGGIRRRQRRALTANPEGPMEPVILSRHLDKAFRNGTAAA